jgi:hypothetical protein
MGAATSAASNSEEDKGYGEVEQKTSSRENVSDVEMQASSGSSSEMEPSSWMMEWQGGLHECWLRVLFPAESPNEYSHMCIADMPNIQCSSTSFEDYQNRCQPCKDVIEQYRRENLRSQWETKERAKLVERQSPYRHGFMSREHADSFLVTSSDQKHIISASRVWRDRLFFLHFFHGC